MDGQESAGGPEPPAGAPRRVGERRAHVLEVLRQAPDGLGVQDLAARVDLHENTVRFHLGRLVEDGAVQRRTVPGSGVGRPPLTYVATPTQVPGRARNFELLARILAGLVAGTAEDPAGAAVAAGEAWGRYCATRPPPYQRTDRGASLTQLMELLDQLGFDPESTDGGQGTPNGPGTPDGPGGLGGPGAPDASDVDADPEPETCEVITLRHCPFLEVAQEHQEVACSVHLGLMQGALAEMRAPLTVRTLIPFAGPSRCVAQLAVAARA